MNFRAISVTAVGLLSAGGPLDVWAQSQRDPASEFVPAASALPFPDDTTELTQVSAAPTAVSRVGLRFDERPLNLQIRFGASTSVGELGVVVEHDVLDRLNLGVGFGTNIVGMMPGVHVRLRPIVLRNSSGRVTHALVAELGGSRGLYQGSYADGVADLMCGGGSGCDDEPIYTKREVWWSQFELGWEMRSASGLLLRASTGAAMTVPNPVWRCSRNDAEVACTGLPPARFVPVLTFAIGYAF